MIVVDDYPACQLALNGSRSDACCSINFVCSEYDIDKKILVYQVPRCPAIRDENLEKIAGTTLDFLAM